MKKQYRDIYASVLVLLLAFFMFYFSKDIVKNTFAQPGPQFFPRIIAVLLALLGALLFVSSIYKIKKQNSSTLIEKHDIGSKKDIRKQRISLSDYTDWLTIIIIAIYVFSMPKIGFVVSTSGYLFFQILLLSKKGERSILSIVIISIVTPILIYQLFTKIFYLMLP